MSAACRLFVLEGPDGVGKTSIAKLLAQELRGRAVRYVAFPGSLNGTLGKHVYRLHHAPNEFGITRVNAAALQLLHIAAHIDAIEGVILPAMREGETIILDRYWWSTWVYGMVSGVPQKSLDAMIRLEQLHWKGVKPTAIFLVDRCISADRPHENTSEQLAKYYKQLHQRESSKVAIHSIHNHGTLEGVVKEVAAICRNGLEAQSSVRMSVDMQDHPALPFSTGLLPIRKLAPAKPTIVYDTYWRFAAERQEMFFRRFHDVAPPWTRDPILRVHKFTNAYRASDRVSQYLIRNVIYDSDRGVSDTFFRAILFKFFNKIETWELLLRELGEISFSSYSYQQYDRVLHGAMSRGERIYSAAYIMPSGRGVFGFSEKHRTHLKLLERMMSDGLPQRICNSGSMQQAFELLLAYPTIGDFLAYQYVTDLNYTPNLNFSEMSFVVPGPGARDGIRKCFSDPGGLNEADLIKLMADRQDYEFERLGITFRSLWGRRLQLIDCQNLFCEVDKYARLKHPEIQGISGRVRIKQQFKAHSGRIEYWYPPKWGINHAIKLERASNVQAI